MVKNSVNHYEKIPMPEILSGITDRFNDIVLGYKEKTEDASSSRPRQSTKEAPRMSYNSVHDDEEDTADLDLTGSPLGADFDPHQKWNISGPDFEDCEVVNKVSGPQYTGVNLAQARGWLSEMMRQEECWALLDQADKERTLYLGTRLENEKRIMSRVLSFTPDTAKVISGQMKVVSAQHSRAGAGQRTVKHQARSEINLINSFDGEGSRIKVVSTWNKVNSLLENPPVDADTKLLVTVIAGDEKLETRQLWTELQLLSGFVRGLEGEGVTWLGGEDGHDVDILVEEVLEAVRHLGPRSGVTKLESETLMDNQDIEPFSFKSRLEVDFTDILWSNLHKVQSYSQLTEAFKIIFSTIIQEEIRPFIYARNQTKVVKLVNSIIRGNDVLPDFSGSIPLEMLIECGLEKIHRDYSHTLLNSELASKESISQLNSTDNLEYSIKKLQNLHVVVELAVLLETHTKLPSDILRSIMSSALSSSDDESPLKRSYEFVVPTQSLEMLSVQNPDTWQLKMTTDIPDSSLCRSVETVVRIVQHSYNDDNDPLYKMYINNEIARTVMN